jgi:hypothetical protein
VLNIAVSKLVTNLDNRVMVTREGIDARVLHGNQARGVGGGVMLPRTWFFLFITRCYSSLHFAMFRGGGSVGTCQVGAVE